MKNSLRKVLLLSAICTSGLSLAACDSGKIKITFWHTMGATLQEVLDRMIYQFEKENPGVKIQHAAQGGYDDLEDKLKSAIPAGTTPTLAYCYPDHVAEYMESNAVVNLDTYINDPELGFNAEDGEISDIIDIYLQEGQEYTKEGTYSLPYAKSTEAMFYNKTIFEDSAHHADGQPYEVPTTWEDLEDLMKEIKADYPDLIPLGYDSDDNLFITLCEQYGIPYTQINKDTGKGEALFNNNAAKAMVQKLVDWYNDGLMVTQATSNGSYTSTQFTEGSLVMTIGSTGGTQYNYSESFSIGTAEVPAPSSDLTKRFDFGGDTTKINNHVIMQGPSICFFKKGTDEQKVVAWKFYKYMIRTLNTAAFSVKSGYSPVRKSSFTSETMQNYLSSELSGTSGLIQTTVNMYSSLTERYFVSPAFHGSSTARTQVGGIMNNVAMGTKTLDEAFADAYTKATFAMD